MASHENLTIQGVRKDTTTTARLTAVVSTCIIGQKEADTSRRLVHILVIALFVTFALAGCRDRSAQLTILFINDLHGHLEPFKEHRGDANTVGGVARLATLVNQIRDEVESTSGNVLLLCAGDILQGTPMSLVFRGEAEVRAMNALRFDAMVIGNHEFDYGQQNLRRLSELASFPMISANIMASGASKPFTSHIVNKYGGLRVAVFGLTTDETPIATHPKNVRDLEFLPPIETAKELVPTLKGKADVVIALTHLGYETDKRLAGEVPGIDVIIGGHSHTRVDSARHVGKTLVCQSYQHGVFLGRTDLQIRGGEVVRSEGYLLPVDHTIPEDEEISLLVSSYARRLDEQLDQPIGTASVRLNGERDMVRSRETNLGNMITDVMRAISGADLAVTNGGSIRASIDEGEITIREILSALPMGGKLVTVTLNGKQISKILNRAASLKPGSGGFLQVSGVSFKIHNKEAVDIHIADQPLDEKRNYRVATNDFLAAGGDGYGSFKQETDYYDTGTRISDLLVDHIEEKGVVGPEPEARIVRE